eukprot:Trichotokara_eunicae@DN1333_c0_g1_i1.p1
MSVVSGEVENEELVQYIIVRNDLTEWPSGALIAQACHASIAAIYENYNEPNTQSYLKNLPTMNKRVVQGANAEFLIQLSENLKEKGVPNFLWVEQPENIVTSLATAVTYH